MTSLPPFPLKEGLSEWLLKCPLSHWSCCLGSTKAAKFLVIVCSVIEVPTFFLPRLLLGQTKCSGDSTVHSCLHSPSLQPLFFHSSKITRLLLTPRSTGNFLSSQTVLSFLSVLFSSQWKAQPITDLLAGSRGRGGGTWHWAAGRLTCQGFSSPTCLWDLGQSLTVLLKRSPNVC